MPPFWGVLLGRQRQRRRRDAKAPSGFSLSSEAAAAAEVQAAAEAAAGSGAAAGECGVRRITGRGMEGGKREAGGRRRGAGPVRAATGHRALRARSLPVPRTPGTRPRTARNSGPIRVRLARVPAPRETRPPRGHALTPCPLPSRSRPPGLGSYKGPESSFRVPCARSQLSARGASSLTLPPHVFLVSTPGGAPDSRSCKAALLSNLPSSSRPGSALARPTPHIRCSPSQGLVAGLSSRTQERRPLCFLR